MEWHIDAWDARGGRAFATQRSRDSDLANPDMEVWGPTVFIGPPSFRPEQIASIGIALSARRSGAFDPRVPLDENIPEIEFGSAEAVAEFVRRAFTNSSRNRGGDGGGGVAFEGGPGEPPPTGEGATLAIDGFGAEWSKMAQSLVENPGHPGYTMTDAVARHFSRELPAVPPTALDSVQSGALQVLAAVLDGLPLYGLQIPYFERWREAATTLDTALSELGLWHSWFVASEPARRQISDYLLGRGNSLFKEDLDGDADGVAFAQAVLRWQSTVQDPKVAAARFRVALSHSKDFADDNRLLGPSQFPDRYEALFTWPVPRYVQTQPESRSVGELLVSFVNTPSLFAKRIPGAGDIVAFAAALLASRVEDRVLENWRQRAALTWLAGSLPKFIFRSDVEALILEPEPRHILAGVGL